VVEYVGLTLAVSLALAALGAVGPRVDGRSFGGFLAHRLVCAIGPGCHDGDRELTRAYGARGASLARQYAPSIVYEPGEPSLPVDYRRCRSHRCADAPDGRALDVHRSRSGQRATAFVRLVRRGGRTYLEYWLYYPDSNTTWAASDKVWRYSPLRLFGRYPGYHLDDSALSIDMPRCWHSPHGAACGTPRRIAGTGTLGAARAAAGTTS
jgi:hypothetical protein